MKILLDTHAFFWWESHSERLSQTAFNFIKREDVILSVSMASIWEAQIKIQLGKLKLKRNLAEIINHQRRENGIKILSIKLPHVLALDRLDHHHKDPFDRLIIAQAIVENSSIITIDREFQKYPVTVIW